MSKTWTHKELVDKAFDWAKGRYGVVVKERVAGWGEIPDVLAMNLSESTLIECKASRADFHADKKKMSRLNTDGMMGTYRLYCCPKDMLKESDIPKGWGLLEVYPSGFTRLKNNIYKSWDNHFPLSSHGYKGERHALFAAIRDHSVPEINNGKIFFK